MKKAICILSVLLNVGLVMLILSNRGSVSPSRLRMEQKTFWRKSRIEKPPLVTTTNIVGKQILWSQIESPDYFVYIANLRALGCPKETIRDMILADVDDTFSSRRHELVQQPVQRFWELAVNGEEMDKVVSEKQTQLKDWHDEREAVLDALLGPESEARSFYKRFDDIGGRMGFLPVEKGEQVLALTEQFDARWHTIQEMSGTNELRGPSSKETSDSFGSALSHILTPAELEEYEFQSSQTARRLRGRLDCFEPTESEFRQIYQLQKSQEIERGAYPYSRANLPEDQAGAVHKTVDEAFLSLLTL
jgi:hypothetical protein